MSGENTSFFNAPNERPLVNPNVLLTSFCPNKIEFSDNKKLKNRQTNNLTDLFISKLFHSCLRKHFTIRIEWKIVFNLRVLVFFNILEIKSHF